MKKHLLLLTAVCGLFPMLNAQIVSSNTCTSGGGGGGGGNIVIFANYDGGVLNINCDVNIPNLKIGVCTYEPVTINITGPYAGNVTEVRYAGYVSTTNNHCPNSPTTTTITGVSAGITSINFLPSATLSNPNGYSMIVCGYSCSTTTNQGGCNTADQIQDYFETTMSGTMYSYYTQYGCWSTSPYNVSAGSNCGPVSTPVTTTFTTSDTSLCIGDAISLTDGSPGATSWSWTAPGSNTPASTSQNLSNVSWNAPGTYTVTLTSTNSNGTCSTSQIVRVYPNPDVSILAADTAICKNDSTLLSASGAITYTWMPGGPGFVQPPTDTWYHVSGTDVHGCSATDSILISVYPSPITPSLSWNGTLLTANGTNAAGYQWYLNGVLIPGATGSTYTPTQDGIYTVSILDNNGCMSGQSLPVTIAGLGMDQPTAQQFSIYPNPGSGQIQFTWHLAAAGEVQIQVTDISGRQVWNVQRDGVAGTNMFTADLSGLAAGMYEVQLHTGKAVISQKLIIR